MRHVKQFVMIFLMIPLIAVCAYAGDLEPPSGDPESTMHTLEDIYNAINKLPAGTWNAPVEKTGLIECWDASGNPISCTGTGQDGEFQEGVAWSSPRFSDNGDGTVTDNNTGLIWLKNANCFGQIHWATAITECNSLESGACGLTDGSSAGDWRLPNIRELHSLIDYGQANPALPSGYPFENIQSHFYWSNSPCADYPLNKWFVNFQHGHIDACTGHIEGSNLYVWPVRGGLE